MRPGTPELRAALEDVYDALTGSPTGANLRAGLRTKETIARALATASASGVSSASGNNKTVSYFSASAAGGSVAADQVIGWRALIDMLDQIVAGGTLALADTALLFRTEMLFRLQPMTELGPSSFAGLRCS